jgi:PKD repeat protein
VTFNSPDTLTCPGAFINWKVTTDTTGTKYLWNFGDGTTSNLAFPFKTYAATGNYSVKLVITDLYGCPDSMIRSNYIRVKEPIANFTLDDTASFCTPFEVNFKSTSTNFESQLWTFEPGATSTLPDPSHYFNTPGSFNVQLVVTSLGGCKDTANRTVLLYDTTGARISYDPLAGCKPSTVSFKANTNGPATYIWDFGDGQSFASITQSTTHLYQQFGKFVPKVILQDPTGCLTPISGIDTLHMVGAITKFGIDKTFLCGEGLINFLDSTTFNDPIVLYNWNFGDGNTSNAQAPSHYYNGAGNYTVSLFVRTVQGCVDSISKPNIFKNCCKTRYKN